MTSSAQRSSCVENYNVIFKHATHHHLNHRLASERNAILYASFKNRYTFRENENEKNFARVKKSPLIFYRYNNLAKKKRAKW